MYIIWQLAIRLSLVEAEARRYIQGYVVFFPSLAKSHMDVNTCNTKPVSQKCRRHVLWPLLSCLITLLIERVRRLWLRNPLYISKSPQNPLRKIRLHVSPANDVARVVVCLVFETFNMLMCLIQRPHDINHMWFIQSLPGPITLTDTFQ